MRSPGSRSVLVAVATTLLLSVSGCSDGSDGKSAGPAKTKEATSATLVEVGLLAAQQGNEEAALSAFQEAARKEPGNHFAHFNIGALLQKNGEDVRALDAYGRALVANPKYVPALFNQATIFAKTDKALAVATYRRVIALQAKAPTAYLNLGLLEAELGQFDQARIHLAKALEQDGALGKSIPKDVFAKEKKTPAPAAS